MSRYCGSYAQHCLQKCCDKFGQCPQRSGRACYYPYQTTALKVTPMMVNLGQEAYWITLLFIIAIIVCIVYYWFFDPKRLRPQTINYTGNAQPQVSVNSYNQNATNPTTSANNQLPYQQTPVKRTSTLQYSLESQPSVRRSVNQPNAPIQRMTEQQQKRVAHPDYYKPIQSVPNFQSPPNLRVQTPQGTVHPSQSNWPQPLN